MKDPQRTYWPLLIVLATFLLSAGVIEGRHLINAAMADDTEFSGIDGGNVPSAIGSLLVGSTSAEIGDAVFLNDVHLQAGPKANLFVVSGSRGVRMLVSLETAKEFQAAPGNVDIKGTIRRLPGLEALRKSWRLSKNQARFFGKEQVYIAADYLKETKSESN